LKPLDTGTFSVVRRAAQRRALRLEGGVGDNPNVRLVENAIDSHF